MTYTYHKNADAAEKKKLLKSLIPKFLLLLRKRAQYKRRFPQAFVDMESCVEEGANVEKQCIIRAGCSIGKNVKIGAFTTVGTNCTMNGKGHITIGKFCSIAPETLIWSENHILNAISTYPFEHILHGEEKEYKEYEGADITIGHDVWIGQRVTILAGAHIGDGCVIAAGSVVTRGEYPPYSVIGGAPGKVLKKRLPEDAIEKLLALEWWNKPEKEIFEDLMPFLHEEQ